MKEHLNFKNQARIDLDRIEKDIKEKKYINLFYNKLSTNLCTLLRESKLASNKKHTIRFNEKSIPEMSSVKVDVVIKSIHNTPSSILEIHNIVVS